MNSVGRAMYLHLKLKILRDCIVYYVAGYLIRYASKITQCVQCINSLQRQLDGSGQHQQEELLTRIRDFGVNAGTSYLKHPSDELFKLLLQLEDTITSKLGPSHELWGDIFFECLAQHFSSSWIRL